jgi:membrane-bound metal-dependent hydrolase YbcI (DUF457 family)
MMGANHALTGAAAWVAITASAPVLTTGLLPLGPVGVFTGAIVCAGAALLPDADHHNATIANSVPVVGSVVTKSIGELTGGHRQGLHSLLATFAVLILSLLIGFIQMPTEMFGQVPIGAAIATMALVAFATKALKLTKGSWLLPWFVGVVTAAAIALFAPTEMNWLPVAITVGFVVHLIGDMMTIGGVPVFWPWKPIPPLWWQQLPVLKWMWQKNGYFAFPVLGKAGSIREWFLGTAISIYIAVVLVYEGLWVFGLDLVRILN